MYATTSNIAKSTKKTKIMESKPEESHKFFSQEKIQIPDWRLLITQQLKILKN